MGTCAVLRRIHPKGKTAQKCWQATSKSQYNCPILRPFANARDRKLRAHYVMSSKMADSFLCWCLRMPFVHWHIRLVITVVLWHNYMCMVLLMKQCFSVVRYPLVHWYIFAGHEQDHRSMPRCIERMTQLRPGT